MAMKKVIIALIIIAGCIIVSSCNRKYCPAYAQSDTEQTEDVG